MLFIRLNKYLSALLIILITNGCSHISSPVGNESTADLSQNTKVFAEDDGLLIIEAESTTLTKGWVKKTDKQASSQLYIEWLGEDNFSTPGVATLTYTIDINSPGRYQVLWRNKIGFGNSSTDFNDSWLKVVGSKSFYAQKKQQAICPIGFDSQYNSCEGLFPHGNGSEGWFKVYRTGTPVNIWSWSTNTSDNDEHDIWVEFTKPGIYQLQISARSKHHAIDKIALIKSDKKIKTAENLLSEFAQVKESTKQVYLKENIRLNAKNFISLTKQQGEYAPAYFDEHRQALAINAEHYKDIFSAAKATFKGNNGLYTIKLNTLTELDGESHYKVYINNKLIGEFINPTTEIDYFPATKTWHNITVNKNDVIRVAFNSVTNGKIPEGNITAFSRGRWQSLVLIPQP